MGDSIFKSFAAVFTTLALTFATPYTADVVSQVASPDFAAFTASFASEPKNKSEAERIPQIEDNPNKDIQPEAIPELTELTLVTETQEDGLVNVSVHSNVERSSQENPITIEDADTFKTLKSCYIVSECVLTVDPNEHANVLAMSGGVKSDTATLSQPAAQRLTSTESTSYNPLTAAPANQAAYPMQLFFKTDGNAPDDPTFTRLVGISQWMAGLYISPVITYSFDPFEAIHTYNYEMYLVDETAGTAEVCQLVSPSDRCDYNDIGFKTGGPHTYRAYIADYVDSDDNSNVRPLSYLTNVQARSNPIVLERAPWKIDPKIYPYYGVNGAGEPSYAGDYEGGPAYLRVYNKLDPILPDYNGYENQTTEELWTPYKEIAHNTKTGEWSLQGIAFTPGSSPTAIESYIGIPIYGDSANPNKVTGVTDIQDKAFNIYGHDNVTTVGKTQGSGVQKGGSNPSEVSSQACVCDPINTYSGEFFETTTDLENISATIPPLAFSRTYSSLNSNVNGPLGYGWTHNYDMKLVPEGSSTVLASPSLTVKQENGAESSYVKMPEGDYLTYAKTKATLTYDAGNNTFSFIRDQKEKFIFNSTGQLISIEDLNGNNVNLTYTAGKLTTVSDEKGQTVTITWSGARISKVANNANRETVYAYSTAGDLNKVTDVTGGIKTYTYISDHRISKFTKPNGGIVTNTYKTTGTAADKRKVVAQMDELGRTTTFSSLGSDNSPTAGEATINYPDGHTVYQTYTDGRMTGSYYYNDSYQLVETLHTYDMMGNVLTTTNPDGSTIINTYDSRGNLLTTTNELGKKNTYEYNSLNLITKVTDPMGRVSTMAYDAAGNLTSTTDAYSKTTAYVYNANGQKTSVTAPSGQTTEYFYDSKGFSNRIKNALNNEITSVNNNAGLPTSTTDAKGATATITYNNAGQPLTSTDAAGAITSYVYDAEGNVTSATNADNKTSSITYDVKGNITSTTDAKGGVTSTTYDEMDRPLTVTDAKGNIVSIATYAAEGDVATATNALNKVTEYLYNWRGQVTQIKLPTGKLYKNAYNIDGSLLNEKNPQNYTTAYTYNNAGQVSTVKDPLLNTTTIEYDNSGKSNKIIRPDGLFSATTYDDNGRVSSETDEKGNVTTYTYNTIGQVSQTSIQGVVKTMQYDANGNVARVTEMSDNSYADYVYDNRNLLTGITYSDNTTPISYTYNSLGQRLTMIDANGVTTYTYDALGNMLTASNTNDGVVTYTYDSNSNLATIKTPSNKTTTYTYDAADNLTKLNQTNVGNISYTYNNDNLLATTTYPSTLKTTNTYNASNRLTGMVTRKGTNTTNLLNYSYAYNNGGLITTQGASGSGLVDSKAYTYDNLNRMDNVTANAGATTTFDFDAIHNVQKKSNNDILTYNSKSQVTGLDNTAADKNIDYAYDVRGNRTTKTSTTGSNPAVTQASYSYNVANQLTEANLSPNPPNTTNVKYVYNGDGLRVKKTTNNSTATAEKYIWDSNASVPLLLEDKTYTYVYGVDNTPAAQIKKSDNTVTYLHADQLGSVRATSNSTGAIGEQYLYDEYGETVGGATAHTGTAFGYAGEYLDKDLGFYYLRARWYDIQSSQFTTVDPKLIVTGLAYGYTAGNPLQHTDPLGLDYLGISTDTWKIIGTVTIAVVATVAISACIVATAGVCAGAAAPLIIAGIGIAAGAADYAINENCKTALGWLGAGALGAIGGGKGKIGAKLVGSLASKIAKRPPFVEKASAGLTTKRARSSIIEAARGLDQSGPGVIYLRTSPLAGNKIYVGKADTMNNYAQRVASHNEKLGRLTGNRNNAYGFQILARPKADEVRRTEEYLMRAGGSKGNSGPGLGIGSNASNPNGVLENKITSMRNRPYQDQGGDF